jgi:hypothetical protein
LISFYLIGKGGDIAEEGTARLEILKSNCAGEECLLLHIDEPVHQADYRLEYKQYLDIPAKQWKAGWHYWYSFPLIELDSTLGKTDSTAVIVRVWFEREDGSATVVWTAVARYADGVLWPPQVPVDY